MGGALREAPAALSCPTGMRKSQELQAEAREGTWEVDTGTERAAAQAEGPSTPVLPPACAGLRPGGEGDGVLSKHVII